MMRCGLRGWSTGQGWDYVVNTFPGLHGDLGKELWTGKMAPVFKKETMCQHPIQ